MVLVVVVVLLVVVVVVVVRGGTVASAPGLLGVGYWEACGQWVFMTIEYESMQKHKPNIKLLTGLGLGGSGSVSGGIGVLTPHVHVLSISHTKPIESIDSWSENCTQ